MAMKVEYSELSGETKIEQRVTGEILISRNAIFPFKVIPEEKAEFELFLLGLRSYLGGNGKAIWVPPYAGDDVLNRPGVLLGETETIYRSWFVIFLQNMPEETSDGPWLPYMAPAPVLIDGDLTVLEFLDRMKGLFGEKLRVIPMDQIIQKTGCKFDEFNWWVELDERGMRTGHVHEPTYIGEADRIFNAGLPVGQYIEICKELPTLTGNCRTYEEFFEMWKNISSVGRSMTSITRTDRIID